MDEKGDRSFSFYRNPGADMMLQTEEVDKEIITQSKIVHFGSLSLSDELHERLHLNLLNKQRKWERLFPLILITEVNYGRVKIMQRK